MGKQDPARLQFTGTWATGKRVVRSEGMVGHANEDAGRRGNLYLDGFGDAFDQGDAHQVHLVQQAGFQKQLLNKENCYYGAIDEAKGSWSKKKLHTQRPHAGECVVRNCSNTRR
jgi:hypothetical protein